MLHAAESAIGKKQPALVKQGALRRIRTRVTAPAPTDAPEKPVRHGVALPLLRRVSTIYVRGDAHRDLSPKTLKDRVCMTEKLIWWLEREKVIFLDREQIDRFFFYLRDGHLEPGGMWGRVLKTPIKLTERTRQNWYVRLSAFFTWLTEEGYIAEAGNPMRGMKKPSVPKPPLDPIANEHITALLDAAKKHSCYPSRDRAIMLFLLDSGVRISELTALRRCDVHLSGPRGAESYATIAHGKGGKQRRVYFGPITEHAIARYLSETNRRDGDYLFASERAKAASDADDRLTDHGVSQMLRRMGRHAQIPDGARISPHFWRRAYAVNSLVEGADMATVQAQMGHETSTMTLHYAKLSQTQRARAHARTSPVATVLRKK